MTRPIKIIALLIIVIFVVLTCIFAYLEFQAIHNTKVAKINAENASVESIKNGVDIYHATYGKYPDDMNDLVSRFKKGDIARIRAQSVEILNTHKKYNDNKTVPTVDVKHEKAQDKTITKTIELSVEYLMKNDLKYSVRGDGRAYRITYKSVDGDTNFIDGNYESDYHEK